jgi:Fungal specific transcription factor domain
VIRCSRDIIRKRRGPKKGSGSVLLKLRDEEERVLHQSLSFSTIESPLSESSNHFGRSISAGSMRSSHFGDNGAPTSNPINPKSAPPMLQMPQHITSTPSSMFAQQTSPGSMTSTLESPNPWPISDPLLPFQASSASSSDFVTVNELAQQIFDGEDYTSISYHNAPSLELPSTCGAPSIDGIVNSAVSPQLISPTLPTFPRHSPTVSSYDEPALYRSISETSIHDEVSIMNLAIEVGMSSTLMSQCVKQYFRHLYPIMPVIHEATFRRKLNSSEDLPLEDKCLLLSMCAVTILHASPPSDLSLNAKKDIGRQFLSLFLDLRQNSDWIERSSLTTIIASYFASVSYFELKQPRSSHFYVREATGMALEQGLHLDSFYVGMNRVAEICHRRTFALLFVTERGASILRNKPISIPKLPVLPTEYFDDEDPSILTGFQCLCQLFALLDEKFIQVWRSSESQTSRSPSLESLAAIQENLSNLSFDFRTLSDIQRADVQITQQWLRLIFWQASMRQGIISSKSLDPAFTYRYPITIAKTLCSQLSSLPINALAVHGLGIFEKVFEVAYTLMDALTISRTSWSDSEELRYLFACLSASPNSHSTYVRMLETRLDAQGRRVMRLQSLRRGGKMLQSPELEAVAEGDEERHAYGGGAVRVRKRARTETRTTDAPAEEDEFVGLRNHAGRMLEEVRIPQSSPAPSHDAVVQPCHPSQGWVGG